LQYEIEEYNEGTNKMAIWVKSNSTGISDSDDTTIYLYYGNSGASDISNATDVWDSNYKGVWHLNDDENDSTSSNFDLTKTGTTNTAGQIADAQDFDGAGDKLQGDSDQVVNDIFLTGGTFDAWVNPRSDGASNFGALLWKNGAWFVRSNDEVSGNMRYQFNQERDTDDGTWRTTDRFSLNVFHKVTVTYDGSSASNDPLMYVDGVSVSVDENATPSGTIKTDSTNPFAIGANHLTNFSFDGKIDEVRISNTIRSADYIKTEFRCQTPL